MERKPHGATSPTSVRDGTSVRRRLTCALFALMMVAAIGFVQAQETQVLATASESTDGEAQAAESAVSEEAAASDESDSLAAAREAYIKAVPQENGSCLTCHTNEDLLSASLSDPDDDVSKYLVSEDFTTSTHGLLGCTYCHGGHPSATDAQAAMDGMTARPTADGGQAVCATCHAEEVANYATSLHNTTAGIKIAWENRLSVASENLGTDLAEQYYHRENGYEGACIDCHASCGECHVRSTEDAIDPDTGLTDGHNFVRSTSNDEITYTCMSCHAGSIAGCFSNYDVHGESGAGMSCMDCHSITDVHGDGVERQTMAHSGAISVECTDCHAADELSGQWHSATHLESSECWACHTSDYNTCESCHGWNAETRGDVAIETHDDCYLGYDLANGKITTLTKAPVDTGMLGDATELILDDADLNTGSTWYAGFVHGVILPEVNQDFCNRCHGEGTALLTEDDLQYPDYESAQLVSGLPEVDVGDYVDTGGDAGEQTSS